MAPSASARRAWRRVKLLRASGFPRLNMLDSEPFPNAIPMTAPSDQLATERRKIDSDIDAPTTKAGDGKVAVSTYTRDILVYAFVPIQDFSASSSIDWTLPVSDIDKQLYDKYGLSDPEPTFIESVVAPMA